MVQNLESHRKQDYSEIQVDRGVAESYSATPIRPVVLDAFACNYGSPNYRVKLDT